MPLPRGQRRIFGGLEQAGAVWDLEERACALLNSNVIIDTAVFGEGGRSAMRLTGEREREVGEWGSEKERE